MLQTNPISEDRNDDLDLLYLLSKGVSFFKRFGYLIIRFSILGIVIGALIYFLSPKQYPSNLIIQSTLYTTEEQIQIVDIWSDFLKRKEYAPLGGTFNLQPSTLKKLKSISADAIESENAANNNRGLMIKVLVTDTAILDSLQNSIVYALDNNGVIKERVAVRKEMYTKLIDKVKDEISKLDSVKLMVGNVMNNRSGNTSPVILDISDINVQLVGLNEKLLTYQENLKFVTPVQVLQPFIKSSHFKYPNIILTTGLGLVGGIFAGFITALLINLKRKLANYNTNRATPVNA